jgi:hypothetical protein
MVVCYFPKLLCQFAGLPIAYEGFLFFTSSSTLVIFCLFGNRHPGRYELMSHFGGFLFLFFAILGFELRFVLTLARQVLWDLGDRVS